MRLVRAKGGRGGGFLSSTFWLQQFNYSGLITSFVDKRRAIKLVSRWLQNIRGYSQHEFRWNFGVKYWEWKKKYVLSRYIIKRLLSNPIMRVVKEKFQDSCLHEMIWLSKIIKICFNKIVWNIFRAWLIFLGVKYD